MLKILPFLHINYIKDKNQSIRNVFERSRRVISSIGKRVAQQEIFIWVILTYKEMPKHSQFWFWKLVVLVFLCTNRTSQLFTCLHNGEMARRECSRTGLQQNLFIFVLIGIKILKYTHKTQTHSHSKQRTKQPWYNYNLNVHQTIFTQWKIHTLSKYFHIVILNDYNKF